MSRLYGTEEALNLILSDEADSDGELAEPVCPGSDEDFYIEELFTFNQRYISIQV